ncbi:hypothetical protein CJ030_MR0G007656 [Morella rubra]|uniref:WAT1-related protein n=1 Tax=Morella rubra TaxID=262757 RepID=A0A6A1UJE1_9ROSI|nr:hypothetical protein CJ030_MR0G007656 [Morella rubra]
MWCSGITVVMVAMECLEVGLNTLSKAAMRRGMSDFVFVVYSNALAICFLLPASLIFYRFHSLMFSRIPRLLLFSYHVVSLAGREHVPHLHSPSYVESSSLVCSGYSSPTLASAMMDLAPAFAFILAILSRMEKLDFRVRSSLAKSIGTMVSVAGALMVTLYRGPTIAFDTSPDNLHNELIKSIQADWVTGGFLLAAGSFCLALLWIVQTWIIKDYPAELMLTLICCVIVTILSAAVSLAAENDPNAWRLRPDIELITIGYSALFGVAIRSVAHTWACHKKGPVYVSSFKPLGIVIASVMGVSFLGDTLFLGSVLGAATIAAGFYAVIWGQAQEEKKVEEAGISSLGSCKAPLLENKSMPP